MRPLCDRCVRKQQFQFRIHSLVLLGLFLGPVSDEGEGRGRSVQTFDVCFDASQNITNIIDLVIAAYVTYHGM